MQNWIQNIIPNIKMTSLPLEQRQTAVINILQEADRYYRPGARNMAGEMFEGIANFKYAKGFMESLKARIFRELDVKTAARLTSKSGEVPDLTEKPDPMRSRSPVM